MTKTDSALHLLSALFVLLVVLSPAVAAEWATNYDNPASHVASLTLYDNSRLHAGTGHSGGIIYGLDAASTSAPQTFTPTSAETPNQAMTPQRSLLGRIVDFLRKLFGEVFVPKQPDANVPKENTVETPNGSAQEPATSKATTTVSQNPIPTQNSTPTPTSPTSTMTAFMVKAKAAVNPEFKKWTDNKVSLDIPTDWEVITYGDCATRSFIARDPKHPIRQVFYFSEAGPVYTSQKQKDSDVAYVGMGGYPIAYLDAPVVNPLNAQSFLLNFKALAETSFMKKIAPLAPKMTDIKVVSTQAQASKLLPNADSAELIRALFRQDGALGEGLFYVETYTFSQFNFGYGMTFIGMSADSGNFSAYEAALDRIIKSYELGDSYVSSCLRAQAQALSGALKAGKTLSGTSDIIMSSWDNRQKTDDILSEKWSDVTLGYERVYDPATGDVYRVENGFYDSYNIRREDYEKSNLELLPQNSWELWSASTLPQSDIR